MDLELCRNLQEATITQNAGMLGSLQWMSPEQATDATRVDIRSDLYSLGLILYFMLTGKPTIELTDIATMVLAILQQETPSPRQCDVSIPEWIDRVCMKLVAKRPEQRYQTATEVIQALEIGGASARATGVCTAYGTPLCPSSFYCPSCGAKQGVGTASSCYCLGCGSVAPDATSCPGCHRTFGVQGHRLVFENGPLAGHVFRIPEGIYPVGRQILCPRDRTLSRRHFHVSYLNGTVHIEDAGSAQNTYVDEQPANRPIALCSNQILRIASNRATYAVH